MNRPVCDHRCICADCWGVAGSSAEHPLFSTRMAIAEALRDAGLSLAMAPWAGADGRAYRIDKPQSDAAVRFHKRLFQDGFEVVRRHTPHKENEL